ncbi:MAG: sulfur carrier protein ThiS [Gammaproteobacteria bacterium]|nr:sulfur carrier protein ThiS [Gammaproteobacteria bacterium]
MEIILNGEATQILDQCSVTRVLEMLELKDCRVAVEVNREVIPRTQHSHFTLSPGDRVEIIQAVGGG